MLTSVFSILPRPSHQHVAQTVHAQTRGEVSPAAVCPATTCQSIIRVWNASMQVHVLAALTLLIASAIKDLLGLMVGHLVVLSIRKAQRKLQVSRL